MIKPEPPPAAAPLAFAPVPVKPRQGGWSPERQVAFIEALADTGSVSRAAASIGMTPESAYHLRRRPGSEGFARAWEAAINTGVRRLRDVAVERAIDGVAVPVFHRGEQVGERRVYNDRLLMQVLRHHDPERYADGAAVGGDRISRATRGRIEQQAVARHDEKRQEQGERTRQLVIEKLRGMYHAMNEAYDRGDFFLADELRAKFLWLEQINHADRQATEEADAAAAEEARTAAIAAGADPAPRPEPRPAPDLETDVPMLTTGLPHHIMSGPTYRERDAARQACRTRFLACRQEWHATVNEEAWAAWKAGIWPERA